MKLFDIGANLTHRALHPHYARLLNQAQAKGLSDVSITAAHPDNTRLALAMIEAYDGQVQLSTTSGLHPHLADQCNTKVFGRISHYAAFEKVRAVGETGLDYWRMLAPASVQRRSFCQHLELAARLGKPVFLHQRDAHADFLAIVREHRASLSKVVVHCFTDTAEALHAYLQLDCSIGITGWLCDPKRGQRLRQLVAHIPDERLMIETDAPYLLPPAAKNLAPGRHNLPEFLPLVLADLAKARGQDVAGLASTTSANARQFFAHTETP